MDEWDAILSLEQDFVEAGRAKGVEHGQAQGFKDALALGLSEGKKLTEEIAFYTGCVYTWMQLFSLPTTSAPNLELISARQWNTLTRVAERLDAFPLGDAEDERITDDLEFIRTKFKLLVASLNFNDHFKQNQVGF